MLILVYGDDTFRVQEKVKDLQAAFVKKFDPTGLNFASFGADAKPGDVLQAIGSLPFMSQKRMVVIRDLVSTAKKDGEDAWGSLARTPESSIVVLWETLSEKEIEKKPLYKVIAGAANQSREGIASASGLAMTEIHRYCFPALDGAALQKWAVDRAKMRGGTMAMDVARELAERVGGDLWQMDNEIRKLVACASGRAIAKADVEELVRASFDGEIFALVDAMSRKEGAKAVRLLAEERASGASDFSIFGMLARQVRILLGARALLDDELTTPAPSLGRRGNDLAALLASEMNIHPFVAQKSLEQARKFTFADLRATHDLLFRYDAGMKSGHLDAELAVDLVTTALVR